MPASSFNYATLLAEQVVQDESLTLPIDLCALTQRLDILVMAKPSAAKGVSGMLIREGDNFAIGYATHIQSIGFQRFSIAHELGHYFLGHANRLFEGNKTVHESQAGFRSSERIEREADHFAAGLLMPSVLFKQEAELHSDGLQAIEKMAERCQTSLVSSAIRYVELTEAAVAIIISSESFVEYCFSSFALRKIKGYQHLFKGAILPRDSLTREFNKTLSNITEAKRDSDDADLISWFHADNEIDASENVIGLGGYGKSLTIITADLPDETESDVALDAPRFR